MSCVTRAQARWVISSNRHKSRSLLLWSRAQGRGYGFVSFKDPADYARAMREMNNKYIGSMPVKLRKSRWEDRQIDAAKEHGKYMRKPT
jgi:myo-inositol-hexaphosphate 3-phosphohydrolase